MKNITTLLFLSLFTSNVIASDAMLSSQTEKDTDDDKVFDVFDSAPEQKVKTMSITDLPIIQLSRISGNFNNKLEKGRYRINDTITITGMGLNQVKNPVVVIHNKQVTYNIKEVDLIKDGISFKLNIPESKYKIFVYTNGQSTNEIFLEPLSEKAPLIFGDNLVILVKGEEYRLPGTGFDADTTVQFGDESIKPISISSDSLSFKVPKSTKVRDFQVRNKFGLSNSIRVFKYK